MNIYLIEVHIQNIIEVHKMAKTEKGKKIVPVKPYTREVNGEPVEVKRHRRSTPNTSTSSFTKTFPLTARLLGLV